MADVRKRISLILVPAASALYLLHLSRSSFLDFGHDVHDHLTYIYYVYKHHALPLPYACRECYHMPLYYVLSALVCAAGATLGMAQPFTAVRFISLVCWLVYIEFGRRLLMERSRSVVGFGVALAMMLFSPMSVISATQILNETPLTMCQMAGFYYLSRWWDELTPGDLALALAWSGLGIAFKSSGAVLTAIIVVAVMLRRLRRPFPASALLNRRVAAGALAVALVGGLPLLRNAYYYRIASDRPESLLVSNNPSRFQADLPPMPLWDFVGFDVEAFLAHPFMEGYKYATPYAWNMTLKSAILTKHAWRISWLGTALSGLLLLLLGFGFATGLGLLRERGLPDWAVPAALFVVVQLAVLLVFRWLYWRPSTSDYRYIYAITPVLALAFVKGLEWCERRHRALAWAGAATAGAFSLASVALVCAQALG